MATNWCEKFRLELRKHFFFFFFSLSPWGQSVSGAGCPERLCNLHLWMFSALDWIKPWAMGLPPYLPQLLNIGDWTRDFKSPRWGVSDFQPGGNIGTTWWYLLQLTAGCVWGWTLMEKTSKREVWGQCLISACAFWQFSFQILFQAEFVISYLVFQAKSNLRGASTCCGEEKEFIIMCVVPLLSSLFQPQSIAGVVAGKHPGFPCW